MSQNQRADLREQGYTRLTGIIHTDTRHKRAKALVKRCRVYTLQAEQRLDQDLDPGAEIYRRLCRTGTAAQSGTSQTNHFWAMSTWDRADLICLHFSFVTLYIFLEEITPNLKMLYHIWVDRAKPLVITSMISNQSFSEWQQELKGNFDIKYCSCHI